MTITIPPAFSTPVALLTSADVTANTGYSNQPKTFTGTDGWRYVFYTNFDDGLIYYASSSDGITWTPSGGIGNSDTFVGNQFATWYDETSNTCALVRVPNVPDGTFFFSIGTPSGGGISWTTYEIQQTTLNGSALGSVGYPSVFIDSSYLWVSLATTSDNTNYYNEVWLYNLGAPAWTNVKVDSIAVSDSASTIVGVMGGNVLARGGSIVSFYETTTDGASWSAAISTVGTYFLTLSGYTIFNDTVYFSTIDFTNDVGAVSYKLGGSLTEVPVYSSAFVLGGASIATDGNSFSIAFTDTNNGIIYFTYSLPLGSLDLNTVTWVTPIVVSSSNHIPTYPQMYYHVTSHSRPSTILAWTNQSTAVMACIVYTPFVGTLISVQDTAFVEDMISVQVFYHTIPPSGASPLSPPETDYISLSYQQLIDMSGIPVTYRIQNIIGDDEYEHPIINFKNTTINAFITILGNDEYEYVEQGLLPNHYANMWVYQVKPTVGDHVLWEGIEWEVRNSIPKVIGGQTVYYRTLLRRILAAVPPELGAGSPGDGGTLPTGTLNSGGQQLPPTGDP